MIISNLLKQILPPFIVTQYRFIRDTVMPPKDLSWGYFVPFTAWHEVQKSSTGYDDHSILEKVYEATQKVIRKEAAFERDSIAFPSMIYNWPLLACLGKILSENNNSLNLLDFGGALGSSYYQNRPFFHPNAKIHWSIIEQPSFVDKGKKYLETDELHFFHSLEEYLQNNTPSVLLFSSILQYLETPYQSLNVLLQKTDPKYLIFDRTIFHQDPDKMDCVYLQKVPPDIYTSSYPIWFFSQQQFINHLSGSYELLAEWDALAGNVKVRSFKYPSRIINTGTDKGFLLKRKTNST